MESGFNHITIVIGDDFKLEEPYNITNQIAKGFFNNNKLIYCDITFPDGFKALFGFDKLVSIMLKLDTSTYFTSAITPFNEDFIAFTLGIFVNIDNVYLKIDAKII